jgi:hypothetical protein
MLWLKCWLQSGAAPEPWLGGGGASYSFKKSLNNKKKTTGFTTQIQVVYF